MPEKSKQARKLRRTLIAELSPLFETAARELGDDQDFVAWAKLASAVRYALPSTPLEALLPSKLDATIRGSGFQHVAFIR